MNPTSTSSSESSAATVPPSPTSCAGTTTGCVGSPSSCWAAAATSWTTPSQEAYVRAYRALPRFRHDTNLGSWLYRIVYNACIDELRRVQRQAVPFDTTAAAGTAWDPASPAP